MILRLTHILAALILLGLQQVQAARGESVINVNALEYKTTIKTGANVERLPVLVGHLQRQAESLFLEVGFEAVYQLDNAWSVFMDMRAFAANGESSSTFDDVETGRTTRTSDTDSFLHMRQLWLRYHGLTKYPKEYLTFGLQRIRSSSPIWWDADLESLVWSFSATRLRLQTGIGERFDTYRTNNELSQIDKDKLRFFAEAAYDWQAYHELTLRGMFTNQDSSDIPEDVLSGAPDGSNGEWLWFGVGLASNWTKRRSKSPFAYNMEWIGLKGSSDFMGESGQMLDNHDISSWALDAGVRYDMTDIPASVGMTFSQGSGGFSTEESNLFVQTGLHSNRGRFVGNRQYLFRYNEALRPDLTNLIHAAIFASCTLDDDYLLAGAVSTFQRDDTRFPIYRKSQPLEMNRKSNDLGYGIDLSLRYNFDRSILSVPISFLRVRSSVFLPGDAFDDEDDTAYRVVLELVGGIWP